MTTTYLFGPNDRRGVDDVRPAVSSRVRACRSTTATASGSGGLSTIPRRCRSRPSSTPPRAGFGLLQRERDYASFLDDDQNFERRPSLWIEPIGDWAAGLVQLIEIPTDSEINDNVLAYWRPKPAAGGRRRGVLRLPAVLVLAAAGAPGTGTGHRDPRRAVAALRRQRRFVVDFSGEMLSSTQPTLRN